MRVTLHNKAVRARACMVCVPDLAPEIKVSAARHTDSLGASTAREKGSAGPVHRRRDCRDVIQNMVHLRRPGLQPSGEYIRSAKRSLCVDINNKT